MLSEPFRTGTVVVLGAALLLPAAASSAATPQTPPTPAAAREAERQADLVAGEDQRLTEALVAGLDPKHLNRTRHAYRVRSSGLFTLVLTRRRAPYTFDDLRKLASDTLVPQSRGTFLLRENIVVAEGATLNISAAQPLKIKMSSGPEGFVSLVTLGGRLRLNGTASAPISLQSWDESRGRADTDVSDGRAYVRASGQLVVRHTSFSRLGFWSGRTGGVSVVGSGTTPVKDIETGAVTATGADDPVAEHGSKADLLPAGKLPSAAVDPDVSYGTTISDATMTGNAFGLFVTGSSGTLITDTVIRKSLVDGLVLHRDVDSATVRNVRVERSGQDGVVVTRKVEGTLLSRISVLRNGRDGVVLAGKPLADGPSASGSSTRPFGNNVLTASSSTDNGRIGIHVIGGSAVRVQGNTVHGGRSGIVVSDGAIDVDIDSNRVDGAHANGVQVRESGSVMVTGNVVRNSPTGIHVRNAAATIKQNSTSGVTLHGITFVGTVNGSVARDNLLSGSGTSAVDVVRAGEHQVPDVAGNDVSGWSRTVTSDSLLSLLLHPLTVIWIFVAVALVGMSRPRRGAPGLPYRADPLVSGSGAGPAPAPSSALPGPLPVPPAPVTTIELPAEHELPREREIPVFALPDRRVTEPVRAGLAAPAGPPVPNGKPVANGVPVHAGLPDRSSVRNGTPVPAVSAQFVVPTPVSGPAPAARPGARPGGPLRSQTGSGRDRSGAGAVPASGAGTVSASGPAAIARSDRSGGPLGPARAGGRRSTRSLPGPPRTRRPSRPATRIPTARAVHDAQLPHPPSLRLPGPGDAPGTPTAPVAASAGPAASSGPAMIDLAIREARLNPAAPRRRRVNGK